MGEAARIAAVGQQAGQGGALGASAPDKPRLIRGVKFHDSVQLGAEGESRSLTIGSNKCTIVRVPGGVECETLPGSPRPDWIFVPDSNIVAIKYVPAKPVPQ